MVVSLASLDPNPSSSAPAPLTRQPAITMAVNGATMPGLVSLVVTRNNFLAADIFSAEVALDATGSGFGAPFWAMQDQIELELMLSLDQGAPQSLIVGLVDEVSIDLARQSMTLTGRDYTSLFIDIKTAEKFQNLSSSQVVTQLAARNGLQAQATATTTPTGKFYDTDHAEITNEVSEWTLLTYLAQREGFDIFVEGRTLFFQPPPDPGTGSPFPVTYGYANPIPGSTASRLILRRSLTLARDVVVKVISWNHESKQAISATLRGQKTIRPTGGNALPPTTYLFREQGLTQDQANALAAAKLKELTQHERRIEIDMPGDLSLTPRSMLRLSGTGTDFDQDYFVAQIRISCDVRHGFPMRVEARNASPQSAVTL